MLGTYAYATAASGRDAVNGRLPFKTMLYNIYAVVVAIRLDGGSQFALTRPGPGRAVESVD